MTASDLPELVVFSSPLCVPCERLKRYLSERDLPFTVRDVMMDEDAGELLEDRGIFSTPVLAIGDEYIIGFDQAEIESRLATFD